MGTKSTDYFHQWAKSSEPVACTIFAGFFIFLFRRRKFDMFIPLNNDNASIVDIMGGDGGAHKTKKNETTIDERNGSEASGEEGDNATRHT